jgi:hypothetical protein
MHGSSGSQYYHHRQPKPILEVPFQGQMLGDDTEMLIVVDQNKTLLKTMSGNNQIIERNGNSLSFQRKTMTSGFDEERSVHFQEIQTIPKKSKLISFFLGSGTDEQLCDNDAVGEYQIQPQETFDNVG